MSASEQYYSVIAIFMKMLKIMVGRLRLRVQSCRILVAFTYKKKFGLYSLSFFLHTYVRWHAHVLLYFPHKSLVEIQLHKKKKKKKRNEFTQAMKVPNHRKNLVNTSTITVPRSQRCHSSEVKAVRGLTIHSYYRPNIRK
jgi:hypothetical protein